MIRSILSVFLLGSLFVLVDATSIRADACNKACLIFHQQNKTFCEDYCRVNEDSPNPSLNITGGFNFKAVQAIGHFVWGLMREFTALMRDLTGLVLPFGGNPSQDNRPSG